MQHKYFIISICFSSQQHSKGCLKNNKATTKKKKKKNQPQKTTQALG